MSTLVGYLMPNPVYIYIYIYLFIYFRLKENLKKHSFFCYIYSSGPYVYFLSIRSASSDKERIDSLTETDIDTQQTKAWTALNRPLVIWKSDLTDKMKRSFFQSAVVSILLYECTTWTLTKRIEKKLDDNYTRLVEQYWTCPGGNTPQSSSYTATYHPSRKLSKLDKPDMQDTAGEVGMSS